jgi:hypothetical protein
MLKNLARITLMASIALCAVACGRDSPTSVAASSDANPEATVETSVKLAKQGDVAALFEHVLPPADFARIKAEWNDKKGTPEPSEEDRQKFADTMAKLTAPDAADTLYAQIEPDIRQFDAQYQQQIPTMVAMGRGYLQGLVQQSAQLSASEKEQANSAIQALAQWVEKTHFTDPALVKKALAILSDTARELDLKTLDEARALNFDQSAPKLKVAINGLKKLFDVYGFSIDQTLDSVKTEVVANDGSTAKVKIDYTLLGTPLSTESEMVRIDDRWYGKDTIAKLREHEAQLPPTDATHAAEPEHAPEPETKD